MAHRASRSRWRDPRLAVGVAVVALCSVLGGKALASADDTVAVWTAAAPLNAGQPLHTGDLVRRGVRFTDQRDADLYLSSDAAPTDVVLDRGVGTGELVPRSALSRASAGALTEVPLSVGTDAVPEGLGVGSTVDVWVTARTADRTTARPSRLVFDDVAVLAAPEAAESLGPAATRQVVVGVSADRQRALPRAISALVGGDVTLTAQR